MKRQTAPGNTKRSWDDTNITAARVILEEPSRYGGLGAFPCIWARLLIQRLEREKNGRRPLTNTKQTESECRG
jgi:hypothetical protein